MGSSETKNKSKETNKKADNSEFNFCTVNSKFKEKNELLLFKTYAYPKGTFTIESTKFLTDQEKYLLYFSQGSNIAAIRYITLKGVHINTLDQDRTSPLHIACKSASLQLIEEIINHGAMINIPDIVGWTPMHIACYYHRKEVILLLLKNEANLFFKDREGLHPYDLLDNDKSCVDAINSYLIYIEQNKQKQKAEMKYNDYEYKETDQNYLPTTNNLASAYKNEQFFLKYIYKQKMMSMRNDETNFSFNEQNVMDFIKLTTTNERIMENYKFIPKKPKFYLNFKESQFNNDRVASSVSFKKNQLRSLNTDLPNNNKLNTLTKSVTFNPNGKVNRSNTISNGYNSFHNEKLKKEQDIKIRNQQKSITPGIHSIKIPKAFPLTKNIGLLKKSVSVNWDGRRENTLKGNTEDSEKTITYKSDTLENENDIIELNKRNTDDDDDSINDDIRQNELNMKMLDSIESEDSFLIDFDISLNEDYGNIHSSKKMKHKERRSRHRSLICKIPPLEEDRKYNDEETFIENNWDKDNSILLEEKFPVKEVRMLSSNKTKNHDFIILHTSSQPKKIFPSIETDYFLTKINLNSIFFKSFLLNESKIEKLLIKLFLCSPDFGILLFLNVFEIKNEYEKLISILRTKNIDRYLLSLILFNSNYSDNKFAENLLENYIMSFDMSKNNLCECLHKVLKNFSLNKDFIVIDKFARSFSKVLFEKLAVANDTVLFNSENSMYMLVFILIVLDIDFKIKENVNFLDFMILVKYLNEGLNYTNEFLKESYKFTKNFGYTNINNKQYYLYKNNLCLFKENKKTSKNYKYSICDDWIMIFNNNDICDRLIYLNCKELYNIKINPNIKTVFISSKGEKKNILIFKFKTNYIKYNKYTKISLKVDNFEEMKNLFTT